MLALWNGSKVEYVKPNSKAHVSWAHALRTNRELGRIPDKNSCVIESPKIDSRNVVFYRFDKGNIQWIPKADLARCLDKVDYGESYIIGQSQ